VTLVQWIIDRERRARLGPLLDDPLGHLRVEFGRFVDGVLHDYVTTHSELPQPPPTNPFELIDLWLAEQDNADLPHLNLPITEQEETLLEMGNQFAQQARFHESELRDVMVPDLRAALRQLAHAPMRARHIYEDAKTRPEMPEQLARLRDPERLSYRMFVQQARDVGVALRRDTDALMFRSIGDEAIEWAMDFRRQALGERGGDAEP